MGVIVMLCAVGALYGKGLQDLWRRRTTGDVISMWRALLFAGGLAAIAATSIGPIHEAAEHSFAAHMLQHMVLVVVAGPMLGAGGAALAILLALPRPVRAALNRIRAHRVSRWVRQPANRIIGGGLMFAGVLWAWHLPTIYMLALRYPAAHALEHVSFVAAAWMLWAAVLTPDKHRLTGPLAFLLLFAVGMAGAALGAVLTFAPVPLYPPDAFGTADSELMDQQLAGLLMWVPMDVVVLIVALAVFSRWLAGLDRRFPADRGIVCPPQAVEVTS